MQIDLSKKEFRRLLDMVYIGNSAAHAGAGRSVRHSASAMSTLNIRFFMSFLLEKSSCFYVEIRHLSDDVLQVVRH